VALTLTDTGFVYGLGTAYATRALEGVSLAVEPGGLAVVLGATGSGKSTLLRLAAGLMPPTEGSVAVDDVDTGGERARELRGRVGLVFQRPEAQLFAETVGDDVAFGPRNLGRSAEEAREDAARALETVGLDPAEFAPRSPFTLSGGEARRVAIAGVLAMRPAYLLLDEPTAGLDARGRDAVLAAVEAARADGAGVLVVTHDAEEFLPLAGSVLVLANGAAAFSGPAGDLLADPSPLEAAGLAVPPVLGVQVRARAAGLSVPLLTLDPELAAEVLAEAAGAQR
jgi:energy-coupling factor transport system ATP-binding protein